MWMLVLITFVNAVLHQQEVQNEYRISLGIIQLGILELCMGVGLLYAFMRGGSVRAQFPVLRTHPVLVWILLPMFLGGLFGIFGALINGNDPKFVLSSAREWFAFPVCALIAYRLIGTPKQVWRMTIAMIIAGVLTATALLVSFGGKTEATHLSGSLNVMRGIINYFHAQYAAVAALVLVFVVMTRFPLWRTSIAVLVGVYCYIGYAAALSRLGFLLLFFGTASAYALLPEGERARKFIRSVVFIPVLFFACWGALWVSDQIIQRDFAGKVLKHIESLLPGDRTGANEKAWDSRLGGINAELAIWIKNPLMGQGFGAGETAFITGKAVGGNVAIKHNGWTSSLAETGAVGFTGVAVMIGSLILIGLRMVHSKTDRISVLVGALGFFTGVVFLLRCSGTMTITSRAAIAYGFVCGLLIRAREMQETQVAYERQAAYYEPPVDEHSGLLVPDYGYGYDMGHFGTTSN